MEFVNTDRLGSRSEINDYLLKHIYLLHYSEHYVTLRSLSESANLSEDFTRLQVMRMRAEDGLVCVYAPGEGFFDVVREDSPVFLGLSMKAAMQIMSGISWEWIASRGIMRPAFTPARGFASEKDFALATDRMIEAKREERRKSQAYAKIRAALEEDIYPFDEGTGDGGDSDEDGASDAASGMDALTDEAPSRDDGQSSVLDSPSGIFTYLDRNVYGQREAKKKVALLIWNHLHGRKRNCLLIGPSGCGKTELFRVSKKVYKNIFIFDASNVTSDGFSGSKKSYSMFGYMMDDGFSKDEIEHSIIVLDEFDKLCDPKHTARGDNVASQIQAEFLSMIEGNDVPFKYDRKEYTINTSGISFVFLGAFERLYEDKKHAAAAAEIGFGSSVARDDVFDAVFETEDLVGFGVRTEILGRIGVVAQLHPLGERDFLNILNDPVMSPIVKLSASYGCTFAVSDQTRRQMASTAASNGLGARYLNTEVQSLVDEAMLANDGEFAAGGTVELSYPAAEEAYGARCA